MSRDTHTCQEQLTFRNVISRLTVGRSSSAVCLPFLHHSSLTNSCHINPPPKIVVATAAPTPWSWHNKSMYSVRTVVWPFGLLLEKSLKRGEPPFFSPKISKSRTKLNTISRLIRYSFLDCPNPHSTQKNIFIRPPVTSRHNAYSASFQVELQSSNQGRSSDPVSNTCQTSMPPYSWAAAPPDVAQLSPEWVTSNIGDTSS